MTIALRYKAHNPLLKVKQLHLKMKIPKNNPHFKGFLSLLQSMTNSLKQLKKLRIMYY